MAALSPVGAETQDVCGDQPESVRNLNAGSDRQPYRFSCPQQGLVQAIDHLGAVIGCDRQMERVAGSQPGSGFGEVPLRELEIVDSGYKHGEGFSDCRFELLVGV
jgi:hypothetical protein